MALETPDTLGMALAFQFIANIPFGFYVIAGFTTISLHIPQNDLGLAGGLYGAFRCVGFSLGSSILNTIFTTQADAAVGPAILEAVTPLGLTNATQYVSDFVIAFEGGELAILQSIPGITPQIISAAETAFTSAFTHGFKVAWLSTIPFGVFALVLSLFVRDPSKYLTHHIAVRLEKEVIGAKHERELKS